MAADALEWFMEQLRRQFNDHRLEDSGITLELYFDAKNVRRAAVGVQGVNTAALAASAGGLDDRERQALVECLFSAGWLGPVRMLAPHQAEFLGLLNRSMDVGDEHEFSERTDTYLSTVEFVNSPEWAVHEISSHSLAQRTFKAIELTRLFWRKKVARWRADGLLPTDTLPTDFTAIVGSAVYQKLRDLFDSYRPKNKPSNLADAVALTVLATEVRHFRPGSASGRLPLFFAPQLFAEVVAEAGLAADFEYTVDNRTYSVLCDANYFIFRSILYPADSAMVGESVTELRESLEDLRRKLEQMLSQDENASDILLELVADRRPGGFDTDQIRNYSFFDQVWLPVAAAAKMHVKGSLRAIVQLMQSTEVQHAISTDLQDLTADLEHNTTQYLRATRLQQKLVPAVAKLESQIPAALLHERPLDVLGLVRFSFPHTARDQMRRLLRKFGTAEAKGVAPKTTRNDVMRALFNALWTPRETVEDSTALAVNAALLWVAKLYKELVDRIEPHRALHFSLTAIYGAAAIECNRLDLASNATDELEELLSSAASPEIRGAIDVALSYLYYHRAVASGFQPCWEQSRLSGSLEGVAGQELVTKAITYARSAAGNKTLDPSLHVYALNLSVFYGVALPMKDRGRLRQLSVQLLQYKSYPVWQYRYEDTIARYFFLGAMEASSAEEMQRDFRFAERHVGLASSEAPFDPRISKFESYLNIIRPVLEARFGGSRSAPTTK